MTKVAKSTCIDCGEKFIPVNPSHTPLCHDCYFERLEEQRRSQMTFSEWIQSIDIELTSELRFNYGHQPGLTRKSESACLR
jgi:hypothetical protein